MGIDRIGQHNVGAPVGTGGASAPARTPGRPAGDFRAHLAAKPVRAAADVTPLGRYRAGEINADEYMDLKVSEATAHLGALSTSKRAFIERALRGALADDPLMSGLAANIGARTST